ncbi:hypothetical protein LCGC14_1740380 [marine sediment metagenome]|uniref:Uncharacterized protein n=1 Tax=marine sediment metagenome TaxID=412755 RepID=A0A0F9JM56_9ZZZZ
MKNKEDIKSLLKHNEEEIEKTQLIDIEKELLYNYYAREAREYADEAEEAYIQQWQDEHTQL